MSVRLPPVRVGFLAAASYGAAGWATVTPSSDDCCPFLHPSWITCDSATGADHLGITGCGQDGTTPKNGNRPRQLRLAYFPVATLHALHVPPRRRPVQQSNPLRPDSVAPATGRRRHVNRITSTTVLPRVQGLGWKNLYRDVVVSRMEACMQHSRFRREMRKTGDG